jgi:hypothetical protein
MGLEGLGAHSPAEMVAWVEKVPLVQLFRVGYGKALELSWRAQKWMTESWFHKQKIDFTFWGDRWGGLLQGLLMKRPLYYTGITKEGEPYREFRTLEEVGRCHGVLDRIITYDGLFGQLFTNDSFFFPANTYQPVIFQNLLLTSWLRCEIGLDLEDVMVGKNEFMAFFPGLWEKGEKTKRIAPAAQASFARWLETKTGGSKDGLSVLEKDIASALFDELETEYGDVSITNLDPRYVSHFLIAMHS